MASFEQESNGAAGNGASEEALPPPPPVPADVVPMRAEADPVSEPVKKKVVRVPIARRGLASKGQKISLQTNHFKVNVTNVNGHFFHYSVALFYEDGRPVDGKGIGRRVLDRVHETYDTELDGKDFAYDGEKSLFTVGALPRNKLEFTIVLEDITSNRNNGNCSPNGHGSPNENDRKRLRRPYQSKTFKVEISFAAKIPMQAIAQALRGQESENSQEALRVLDIILRQHAAKQGCLLVRQSFFHNDVNNFTDVGGGVLGCRGFHSSFRTTQGGLSLNIDVSTTMIIQPGPVVDFLIANQNVKDPFTVDWAKAKRVLKNLRVKTSPTNTEYKITGLSDRPCKEQTFTLKQKGGKDDNGEVQSTEITVYDYFVNHRHIELRYSAELPCINVGKPKRPTYFPLELCSLVSLQRYTKALSTLQRSSLVEKSRQKPQERMKTLTNALKINNYTAEPMLRACGVSISNSFTQVEGRVLSAPRLKVGNGEDFFPRNGRWNFNNKKLVEPTKIERWAVVNFSARCNIQGLIRDLIKCGDMKGISIGDPFDVFEENPQHRRAPPLVRVEKMFEAIQSKLPGAPQFLLCLLPERKNSNLYGPWKRKNLSEYGIVTQCIAPTRVNDQYLTNVLLKINAKPPRYDEKETAERVAALGISVGLVWTMFGGEVQFVEATSMVGKGDLHLTGQLGDVIKESAQIALTWVRARATDLKLAASEETNLLDGRDVHIHFPAGAIPKDGPSAGVTLVTALVSLFSQRIVRADTAMTGEMTLRGLVLPVGGIKDKVLAAHRYGVKRVILPERNLKDLVEVPSAVLASMEILVKRMEDVLEHAFVGACPWRRNSKL